MARWTDLRRGPVAGACAAVVLAAAYAGTAVVLADRTPNDTTVGAVPIGGMSGDAARSAVAARAATQGGSVTVTASGKTFSVSAAEAGLVVDVDRSLAGLTGFTLNPLDLFTRIRGGAHRDLAASADRKRLAGAVARGATAVAAPATEGVLGFDGGTVVQTPPRPGVAVDVERTADAIVAAWPEQSTVDAVTGPAEPRVSAAELQRVRTSYADKVVSAPITVTAGSLSFPVAAALLTPAISFAVKGDRLEPVVDAKKLSAAVHAAAVAKGVEKPARDAQVDWVDGGPTVTPHVPGTTLTEAQIAPAVTAALTSDSRKATIGVTVTQPTLTTEQARAALPKGLISSFTTHFPYNPVRTTNLRVAAGHLDGTYVAPGATFSLNGLLGERTAAKGYQKAQVISDGRLTYNYGGGISQVSTTLFNAAFFAGVQLDEFHPHSFYIARYPEGREATISWPDVDNRWTNTTDGGILIKAWLSGQEITVQFYGTKTFDVATVKGPRRNIVQPRTIHDDLVGCVPQSPSEGFDVTVSRVVRKGGLVVRSQNISTHYIPEDKIVCSRPYTP